MELWEWDLRGPARTWRFDEVVGCVALQASGELLLGLERGLCSFDVASGAITLITPFEEGRDTRPNDGRCGPIPAAPILSCSVRW
jgi:sugar lactone lactonase YvrE